ncbi:MAG: PepSY domain-containing protein [Bryobacteraceae bacterium]
MLGGIKLESIRRHRQNTVGKDLIFATSIPVQFWERARGIRTDPYGGHRWLGRIPETPVMRSYRGCQSNLPGSPFGVILIPKVWKWQSLKAVALFRGGLSGKARDFNWHNVIGLWLALPLLLIIVSGAVISFPWATSLVFWATGTTAPAPAKPVIPMAPEPALKPGCAGIDRAWAR